MPNERSSHAHPTPRIGGVAIILTSTAVLAAYALFARDLSSNVLVVAAGSLAAGLLGLTDDTRSLTPSQKLVGQIAIAVPVVVSLQLVPGTLPPSLIAAVAVLWLVAYMNMFNFMDGSDGLAGGIAVIMGVAIAGLAYGAGQGGTGFLSLAIAAAAFGFLRHNAPPASVFMGDAGSFFLGSAFGMIALICLNAGVSPLALMLVLHPFVFDASFTLVRRALKRERLWHAHRQHLYQRLLQSGLSHAAVARRYYAWQAVAGVSALVFEYGSSMARSLAISAAVVAVTVAVATVWRLERRRDQNRLSPIATLL